MHVKILRWNQQKCFSACIPSDTPLDYETSNLLRASHDEWILELFRPTIPILNCKDTCILKSKDNTKY